MDFDSKLNLSQDEKLDLHSKYSLKVNNNMCKLNLCIYKMICQ